MVKWLTRLAILAAFLGVAGTIGIISFLHGNQRKEKQNDEIATETSGDSTAKNTIIEPQAKTPEPKPADTLPAAIPEVLIKKEDTARKVSQSQNAIPEKPVEQAPVKPDEKKENKPESELKGYKQNDVKKDQGQKQSLLNQKELRQIFIRLNRAKANYNIYSNCVQIFTAEAGNNRRAALQVETFLKSHHYTIAGRETVSKKVKGIQITPAGGCIRVTVGSF